MNREITEFTYSKLSKQLDKLESELPKIRSNYQDAAKLGDASENADLDAAREKLSKTMISISEIKDLLNSDVIEYDTSDIIRCGSFILVTLLRSDDVTEKLEDYLTEPRLLLFEDVGGTVLEGVLNTKSQLGKIIKGNPSGIFNVGRYVYNVKKIQNPDIDSFTVMYPDDDFVVKKLFEGGE